MSSLSHTFGPTCHLACPVTFSNSERIPDLKPHFFHCSQLPIDDPLTVAPIPTGAESKASNHPPRPFSARDSNALEEAWLGLMCRRDRSHHRKQALKQSTKVSTDKHDSTTSEASKKHGKMHAREEAMDGDVPQTRSSCVACSPSTSTDARSARSAKYPSKSTTSASGIVVSRDGLSNQAEVNYRQKVEALGNPYNHQCNDFHHVPLDMPVSLCCPEGTEVRAERRDGFTGILRECDCCTGQQEVSTKVPATGIEKQDRESLMDSKSKARKSRKDSPGPSKREGLELAQSSAAGDALKDTKLQGGSSTHGVGPQLNKAFGEDHKSTEHKLKDSKSHQNCEKRAEQDLAIQDQDNLNAELKTTAGNPDSGTTGFPYKGAPCRGNPHSRVSSPPPSRENDNEIGASDHLCHSSQSDISETIHVHRCKLNKKNHSSVDVPVGIAKLHLVKLPCLQMMPIYWSPVHDIASVIRGTWFYKDTMYPVEPSVANQLEIGYRELQPWSQTWNDELNSAIEVGAAGEEKISHRIWPKDSNQKTGGKKWSDHAIPAADSYCAARCFHGEFAAAGTVDDSRRDDKVAETAEVTKRFLNSHVIYKDSKNAFILKPSLQPSEYLGRRPLAKIMKGNTVGIPVVRGFDWKAWEKLHPSKKPVYRRAEEVAGVAGDVDTGKKAMCAACREQEERPRVTDLIMVIHGIGQKLSERVESFHFTHAINAFRRSVNIELCNPALQSMLCKDLGSIMVLPVNWRSSLAFDDNYPAKSSNFSLKDITPDTIPAVRNLISDVMLDIPFYMSHHKPKMIQALITEANRVYRLWCRNNPEFHKEGRVHIIAHSLGSVMALDVLSKQATCVIPSYWDKKMSTKHFEFNTTNLFFVGSPCGFFLLLEKGGLTPRRCRNKPGVDHSDDNNKEITGEAGVFGCLAVDNLFNIINPNDPIAYRLNTTVDTPYAASLKDAQVPSASTSWFGMIVRSIAGTPATPTNLGVAKPQYLPHLEMEEHDFSREEIAEKKFYLLNDNGQIDYFLAPGNGPLEFQYLNMLSAHSSYWGSPDFVRLIVTETGRKPGKHNTLPGMKAVKVGHK